jgi:hypothetical protein
MKLPKYVTSVKAVRTQMAKESHGGCIKSYLVSGFMAITNELVEVVM